MQIKSVFCTFAEALPYNVGSEATPQRKPCQFAVKFILAFGLDAFALRREQRAQYVGVDLRVYLVEHALLYVGRNALHVDQYGLDEIDNKILLTIIDKFRGGPVGITTIATAIGEDAGTVEEVYEPYLIMEGFIKRTPRGRMVTELAYKHFGRKMYGTDSLERDLFGN